MTEQLQADEIDPIRDAIEQAEEIPNPLEGLVERTVEDPGAPFASDVLECLIELKAKDRPAFEALRARLKKADCRVTELDKAMLYESGDDGRGPTQADILVELSGAGSYFHTPDGKAFADLTINNHRETWRVRSTGFRNWLIQQYFKQFGGAPSSEALQSALNAIEASAHYEGPEREVFIRVGSQEDRLYLDLGDDAWRAVEIDASGWRVVPEPPVRFVRPTGLRCMPIPERGGSIDALRNFLNVKSDEDFVLVVGWALAVLRNRGPYPVLVISGEQGSAKSTFSAILRALLDPNTAPLRALPRDDHNLFIAASNGHVLAFDNLSVLPASLSDTLCRLATGGGFAMRQLYTDQDEVLFDAARPIILNGIEQVATRSDLADRALFLTLEAIPDERRQPESEIWAAFENERPRILGVLLNAVSEGIRRLPETRLPNLPRMADFTLWATACETALWPSGTFWDAYNGNRDEAVESVIDADPVASAVRDMMMGRTVRTVWTGTASDLLGDLTRAVGEVIAKSKTWPNSARALSGRLRRAEPVLRKVGINLSFEREGQARTRTIWITRAGSPVNQNILGTEPSAPSVPSATEKNSSSNSSFGECGKRTVASIADANSAPGSGNRASGSDTSSDLELRRSASDGQTLTVKEIEEEAEL